MTRAATGLAMAIRVPVFTAATVTLGVAAHLAGGGTPPSAGLLGLLLGTVALTSLGLSRGEQRLPRLILGVAAVQVGVHVGLLGHHHAPALPKTGRLAMTAAHAAAALALAWWLRHGEAAAWRPAARTILLLFGDPIPVLSPAGARFRPAGPRSRPVPALPGPVRTVRGPPA